MANYYIDYENVHNEGLKGVQKLQQEDKLHLFYSIKADTLKIDVVRQLMECPATICFDKIVNGVENALDFQLITALMCNYSAEEKYYIISRDKGYDAAIEMAGKQNRDNIYRCRDIDGAIKHQDGLGIDESDQEVIVDLGDLASDYQVEDKTCSEEMSEVQSETVAQPVMPVKPLEAPVEAIEVEPEEIVVQQQQEALEPAQAVEIIAEDQEITPAEEEEQPQMPEKNTGEAENEAVAAVLTDEEIKRRAHQSICTKILNHIKLIQKIPLVYKQAEDICEALEDSETKMQFYHRLLQSLGRKKGGELYQKVKAVYKPIRGIYQASLAGEDQFEENKVEVNIEVNPQNENNSVDKEEGESQEKSQRTIIRRGRSIRTPRNTVKSPRGRRRTRQDGEAMPEQQGTAEEGLFKMTELEKNI